MPEPVIRFRLTQLDIISLSPSENSPLGLRTSPFLPAGHELTKVPVIRIFGSTPAGQRVLTHVHGAMSYFYVQYDGPLDPDTVQRFIRRLGHALNYATAASLGQVRSQDPSERACHQYVAYIALCKGVPFYGFHVGHRYFLKIYCLQTRFKKRMADLLRRGKVINPSSHSAQHQQMPQKAQTSVEGFKIFEEHIPFHLQFMIDHNLYGCGMIELSQCTFRRPLPDDAPPKPNQGQLYSVKNVPKSMLGPPSLTKSSYCTLELDCHVSDIMNRKIVGERALHDGFHELLQNPIDTDEKLVHSVKELWEDERRRRQARGATGPQEVRESSQRDYGQGDQPEWAMEPDLRQQIKGLIEQDLRKRKGKLTFESFVKPETELSKLIPTTFRAVDAIHPANWIRDEAAENPYGVWAINGIGTKHRAHEQPGPAAQVKVSADMGEEDVCAAIDVSALQSQMEHYKDDGPDEEHHDGGGLGVGAVEEDEDGELTWDEADGAEEVRLKARGDLVTTPRKPKAVGSRFSPSKARLQSAHPSPATTPSKRQNTLVDHFSPHKRADVLIDPKQSSSTVPSRPALPSPTALRKRTIREQDDGFAQPKASKLMMFMKRSPSPVSHPVTSAPIPQLSVPSNYQVPQPSATRTPGPSAPEPGLLDDLTFSDLSLTPSTAPNPSSQPPFPSSSLDRSSKRLQFNTHPSPRSSVYSSWYIYSNPSPRVVELLETLVPAKVYRDPYYSDPADVPTRKREYGGRVYAVSGSSMRFVPEFQHSITRKTLALENTTNAGGARVNRWEFANRPPRLEELRARTIVEKAQRAENFLMVSQIEGPTQKDKYTPIKKAQTMGEGAEEESQHMDVLAIEIHGDLIAKSREYLRPDPAQDEIEVVFYCLQSSRGQVVENGRKAGTCVGMIIVGGEGVEVPRYALGDYVVEVVETELELLNALIEKVRAWDPEVLTGFELESWSWGYVMHRGRELDFDVVHEFGRVRRESYGRFAGKDDKWGYTHGSSIKVSGRHVLSIWRIIRSDFAVTQYTFENLVFHILHIRLPHYSFGTLDKWWRSGSIERRRRVLLYYLDRVELDVHLMDETEIISRNAEISRVLGVDFFSAISRGSQFKVESVLFRIAKPENYLLPSPSREEVGQQNAAECIPLIMEPQSAYYKSPLVVLDFQSLYPSVMIAYNYCYSTCLGRVGTFKGSNKFGIGTLDLPDGMLGLLQDHLIVSPNGFMFVKPQVRKSLLSKMLSEFLETRVMIKESIKAVKDDKAMCKMMNARQLGLKFIANVTYGYTSATFSGRMPCVEIADAIVQTGRETLEKSMEFIQSVKEWDAKVVYGDTDSLFVYLPGRTKEDAFRIGQEMAEAVTKRNPAPVKLKFEKVYLPCVLMAKKRYVGAKYEHLSEVEAGFEAKGIEVIRRDGIPALQKIQETCLKKLFRTQDLSDIKAYLYRQWQRLLLGKVSIQDFTFAKEVRLGTYSENVPPPPGALIAARKMAIDPRTEPAYAERVPYVIVKGAPQSRLRDRAVPPETVLQNRMLALDSEYYITKVFIPSLSRIFNLIGVDVASWYASMPKFVRAYKSTREGSPEEPDLANAPAQAQPKVGIMVDEHFKSDRCLNCDEEIIEVRPPGMVLCQTCCDKPAGVGYGLMVRARAREKRLRDIERSCRVCGGIPAMETVECDSLDCGRMYERVRALGAVSVDAGSEVLDTVGWLDEVCIFVFAECSKNMQNKSVPFFGWERNKTLRSSSNTMLVRFL
ncbi:hypothetical protein CROQUDRAFT_38756 [Cronartium quercuum f. sp. fusiforme G11]|uniref:DNA polymerase n=1 Tax=Cronartium quercuum f. sp. fusiforme G11 TaxID=708437 RepID=A0A9P6NTR2_9BASI|nr:hypothetical protein CROQUDRAFT_38756 [Cronartium quercuum f. sp. fusiforme G11]